MHRDPAQTAAGPERSAEQVAQVHDLVEGSRHSRLRRLAALAAEALAVPVSAVTLLDGRDARFVVGAGLPDSTPASYADLCRITQQRDTVLVVEDAADHPDHVALPMVRDGGIRFYVGYPLHDRQGVVVASLCLMGREPRRLGEAEARLVAELAALVQEELTASAEMQLAGDAQRSLLPEQAFREGEWLMDGMCLPSLAVGGDFYDYGGSAGVAFLRLGDVMGKGTPAALIGAGVRAALRGTHEAVAAGVDLGVTVTRTARGLQDDFERSASFVTLFEAALDLADGRLRWVDAGCGLAVLRRADGTVERLGRDDLPLGVLAGDHWTQHETVMGPGDRLLVFSDGLLDVLPTTGWTDAVAALLARHDTPAALLAEASRWVADGTVLDDVTLVALARTLTPEAS